MPWFPKARKLTAVIFRPVSRSISGSISGLLTLYRSSIDSCVPLLHRSSFGSFTPLPASHRDKMGSSIAATAICIPTSEEVMRFWVSLRSSNRGSSDDAER